MNWKKYCDDVGVKPIYSERFSSSCLYGEHISAGKKMVGIEQQHSINMLYNRHREDKYKNKLDVLCSHDIVGKLTPIVIKQKKNNKYVDGILDLHGMNIREAYDAFLAFIQNAFIKQYISVLIITGKGIDNQGEIRKCFYYWMEYIEIRDMVLSCEQCSGNDGAFYVNIKKNTLR